MVQLAAPKPVENPVPSPLAEELPRLLLVKDDEDFVRWSYRLALRREPDAEGFANYISQSNRRVPRMCILHQIARSQEGWRVQSEIPGLWHPLSVAGLLSTSDSEFLPVSYRSILWREIDETGRQTYSRQLEAGRERRDILRELVKSPEARNIPVRIEGTGSLRRDWHQIAWIVRTFSTDTLTARPRNMFRQMRTNLQLAYARMLRRGKAGDALPLQLNRLEGALERTQIQVRELSANVSAFQTATVQCTTQTVEQVSQHVEELREIVDHIVSAAAAQTEALESRMAFYEEQRKNAALKQAEALTSRMALYEHQRKRAVMEHAEILASELQTYEQQRQKSVRHQAEMFGSKMDWYEEQRKKASIEQLATIGSKIDLYEQHRQKALVEQTETLGSKIDLYEQHRQKAAIEQVQAFTGLSKTNTELIAAKVDAYEQDHRRQTEQLLTSLTGIQQHTRASGTFSCKDLIITQYKDWLLAIPEEDVRLAAYVTFRGSLEPGLDRFFASVVRPGMTVVDIGANIGLHTLPLAQRVGTEGRVFCFEPSPRIFDILQLNLTINDLASRTVAHKLAITDRAGEAELHIMQTCGHTTLFHLDGSLATIRTPTASLDDVLPAALVCDLIKIDAEGAEPLIIRGMQSVLRANPHIQIILEYGPEHLVRAGLLPSAFIEELLAKFLISRVDPATGQLSDILDSSDLRNVLSANLLLIQRQREH